MRDRQAGNEDLLSLRVPCEASTETLEQLAACMYSGGRMMMNAELLVPMLQLGDGIQVRARVCKIVVACLTSNHLEFHRCVLSLSSYCIYLNALEA